MEDLNLELKVRGLGAPEVGRESGRRRRFREEVRAKDAIFKQERERNLVEEESGSEESVYGVRFESDGGAGVGNLRVQAGGGGELNLGNSVFRFCKLRHS